MAAVQPGLRVDLPPSSVAVVLGTRPEIIKLAHIIRLLGPAARVIHTGQHYDANLSEVFFGAFGLSPPGHYLEVGGEHRGVQIGEATTRLTRLLEDDPARAVVVQGDTNAVMAGALAANATETPLVHVEAGLRSHDRAMPEEHNRVVCDHLSDLLLAPTETAAGKLAKEGIADHRVAVTGNTVVEAVGTLLPEADRRAEVLARYGLAPNGFILSTFHRPENVDDPGTWKTILSDLARLPLPVVLALHPRSRRRVASFGLEPLLDRLQVIDPLPYGEFLALLAECALSVSDSGGLQEEVSVLKRPMVVVRNSTERPEVIGTFAVLRSPGDHIDEAVTQIVETLEYTHSRLAETPTPYGDGTASVRSVTLIEKLVAD
ncbi:MAG: UDP-N-acetylglucosamine 2-epimerase (non-hydrolyzing) [Acidimicrobiia bacterium]|nr:UDP-N-acetylglucosamine 2-epimerase (non-hydrolyzing) [Acidimicrobiia bacterium]MYH06862.1 UDP-N-acetylglucosamine 2-epimerase (non-hydrolyzing) [Acidimicrobiia bacterium]MYK55407.1 UDP-N-acetylglucosamine 2-epimerase (non-hydrolyzing) [Acidimicrobiia bacterium]